MTQWQQTPIPNPGNRTLNPGINDVSMRTRQSTTQANFTIPTVHPPPTAIGIQTRPIKQNTIVNRPMEPILGTRIPSMMIGQGPGIATAIMEHQEHIHNQLRSTITFHLAQPLDANDRTTKTCDLSIQYSGERGHAEFKRFLTDLCINFNIRGLGGQGPTKDRKRVYNLIPHLQGDARTMCLMHIESMNKNGEAWTFEETICALYDRFVQPTTANNAREKLRTTRYNPQRGVGAFYDEICTHSNNMIVPFDDRTLTQIFLAGLPPKLRDYLILSVGLEPEIHTIEEFRNYAVMFESKPEQSINIAEIWGPELGITYGTMRNNMRTNAQNNFRTRMRSEAPKMNQNTGTATQQPVQPEKTSTRLNKINKTPNTWNTGQERTEAEKNTNI